MQTVPKNDPSLPGHWTPLTSGEAIGNWIDLAKKKQLKRSCLVPLLHRNNPIYTNRRTNEINRIRGYSMASFEVTGLPSKAVIFVLEELQNGHSPYLIAAAAKAIRGLKEKSVDIQLYLKSATQNLGHKDEAICFDAYRPEVPLLSHTTAKKELINTFMWLGSFAKDSLPFLKQFAGGLIHPVDRETKALIELSISVIDSDQTPVKKECCQISYQPIFQNKCRFQQIKHVTLQDQNGRLMRLGEYFLDSITIVLFFYTRCDNPSKCSLSIEKLGLLQRRIKSAPMDNIKICAISYDSEFDNPRRLKKYSENRGLIHNETCKTFRIINKKELELVHGFFNSSVNYTGSIVNGHSIELFILGPKGKKIRTYTMIGFDVDKVYHYLSNITKKSKLHLLKQIRSPLSNTFVSFLFLLFPKCPLCWATYLSALGLTGIPWLKNLEDILWLLVLFSVINAYFLYKSSQRSGNYLLFVMGIIGYISLGFLVYYRAPMGLMYISTILIIASSITTVIKSKRVSHGKKWYFGFSPKFPI